MLYQSMANCFKTMKKIEILSKEIEIVKKDQMENVDLKNTIIIIIKKRKLAGSVQQYIDGQKIKIHNLEGKKCIKCT